MYEKPLINAHLEDGRGEECLDNLYQCPHGHIYVKVTERERRKLIFPLQKVYTSKEKVQ